MNFFNISSNIRYINLFTSIYWISVLIITLLSLFVLPIKKRILVYGKLIQNRNVYGMKMEILEVILQKLVY